MDRYLAFLPIKHHFWEVDKRLYFGGNLPYRDTKDGIWGAADMDALIEFFHVIKLQDFRHFADLGSGDGRVVAIASLFTKATGIESEESLVKTAELACKHLGVNPKLVGQNFMDVDFSQFDCLFINPDKRFPKELEEKIKREFKGRFFVYNHIFKPVTIPKGRTYWHNQIPINEFIL